MTRTSDGKEAVKIFAESPPGTFDLILMDVMMPEMNSYEATKAIRTMNNRPDDCNIPINAMTANAFAEDVQASLDITPLVEAMQADYDMTICALKELIEE